MDRLPTSNVSVDALALRYDPAGRRVEFGTSARIVEPFTGQLALPGVTLLEGERLADAVRRAVEVKLGLRVRDQGQLTVFDEPHRDPRGQTLSVVMWAVVDNPDEAPEYVRWFGFDDIPELAFDHAAMARIARPLLAERLWRDRAFTRALTGPEFPVSTAVALTHSINGQAPDRGNLNRRLASVKGLDVSHRKVVLGRGRPGTLWAWQDATAPQPIQE